MGHMDSPCSTDEECAQRYNTTISLSKCQPETRTCSNPFKQGCLRAKIGDTWTKKRVCNSDDKQGSEDCRIPKFGVYPELRIHNGNWESSIFMAWITEILLMELADVPASVGLTKGVTPLTSFYNPENAPMQYSKEQYPWDALKRGDQLRGCTATSLPCVQYLPEVWKSLNDQFTQLLKNDMVEPPAPNGLLGQSGLHIPLSTAEKFPDLSIWFGWRGEEKRKFLAETFLRPLTWADYCAYISATHCSESDETAQRAPESADEETCYFLENVYNGYFHASDKNNCTLNPTTCTGAILGAPCQWAAYTEGQLYYNGIVGLEMDGPIQPNGGYTGPQLRELWKAANWTKSHVIMYWYEPDPLPVEFFGLDYAFQMVALPPPSYECEKHRPSVAERCSSDPKKRIGNPEGACMNSIQTLSHIIAKAVADSTSAIPEADQSPGYGLLKNIKVTSLDMGVILQTWQGGKDPREALCDWVVENLDQLQQFVPPGYPRKVKYRSNYSDWYLSLSIAFGSVVVLATLIALLLCFKYRETKTMVFAQPLFMMLILCGFLLISTGSVLNALEPSLSTCTASAWLIVEGYTVELGAVLVKTAAINALVQSSKKMERVNIRRNVMLIKVLGVVGCVSACMIAWTVLDPPKNMETRTVIDSNGSLFVEVDLKCASKSSGWRLASFAWQLMLLILAAVLAFQSRHVMEQLNESKSLALMVYSHFLFVCLRGVSSFFYVYDTLPSSGTAALFSLNYSLDALFAMSIYVFPKIWESWRSPSDYKPGRFTASARNSSANKNSIDEGMGFSRCLDDSSIWDESDDLKILVCTANIGNAEPTVDSLEAWIPPGGSCDRVNPLDGKSALIGTFDLIAIGMQEATWAESARRKSLRSKSTLGVALTDEEVLNALEEKNTAVLREMLQETLGESYCQVADEQRGQMRLHLWAKRSILKDIMDIRISGSNKGIGNVLANKGGIVATLYYRSTRISFLSAHLAAHEGRSYYKTRCDNMKSILREAKTFSLSKKFDDAMTAHHMFVFGDLNFRTRFDSESKHEDNINRARELIAAKDFESLYLFDELQEGLGEGHLLVDFETLPCNFPPTFKVERRRGYVYKEQRTPSYTDRILFKSAEGLSENLKPLAYEPCVDFITSDHKPIRGAFTIKPNDSMGYYDLEGDLHIVFRKMRCSGLPAGDADGKSDPYLMFLWESIDLHTDSASFMDTLRELWMGQSWPRIKYISKTLNPYWKGERMHLSTSNTRIGHDAMLFVAAIDYDAVGKDEFLGGMVLNVRELIKMKRGESQKTITIDKNLLRDGKFSGRIKCNIDVSVEINKRGSSRLLALGRAASNRMLGIGGSAAPLRSNSQSGNTELAKVTEHSAC